VQRLFSGPCASLGSSRLFFGSLGLVAGSGGLFLGNIELAKHFESAMRGSGILYFGLPVQLRGLLPHLPKLQLCNYRIGESGNKSSECSDCNCFLCGVLALLIGAALSFYGIWEMNFGSHFWRYVIAVILSAAILFFGFHTVLEYLSNYTDPAKAHATTGSGRRG